MNILLVYPKYPDTFWSFKHALKFISKKATNPPLGLITIAPLLPDEWQKKIIDLNVSKLKTKHILWADYVFISAMSTQFKSANEIIKRCRQLNRKIVAGGPLFTEDPENFPNIDHLVLNEAEITLPQLVNDLKNGSARKLYQTSEFPEITGSPLPDYSLLNTSKYATLSIQYTRGCPFDCEFCDITALFGRKVRTKSTNQILSELENLYNIGWRGNVFFVDDNFIGNKRILKSDLLPSMISWMRKKNNPFVFNTEASINLADDDKLMELMTQAGFSNVFVGIETPEEACLVECNKTQNINRDLIQSVRKIQAAGMEVTAGFIVGFDSDPPSVFQRQIDFIQKSGIITAMVGLLNAPKKTRLYRRLKNEGRIISEWSGDNTDYTLNFIPKMNKKELINGYQKIIQGIYSCKPYYNRVLHFLKYYEPKVKNRTKVSFSEFMALLKSIVVLGIYNNNRNCYWHMFFWSLFNRPKLFPLAIRYLIYGYHFRRVFKDIT
ncbi:MAG: DUF4070 domain-containing protein [Bacteroidales bacterium]|nr:DUF4070 domain-containing protein [Bacteroidales bacterium]